MRRALLFALTLFSLPALAEDLQPFSASYTADWKQLPVSGSAERSLKREDDGRWTLNFEASMLVGPHRREHLPRRQRCPAAADLPPQP